NRHLVGTIVKPFMDLARVAGRETVCRWVKLSGSFFENHFPGRVINHPKVARNRCTHISAIQLTQVKVRDTHPSLFSLVLRLTLVAVFRIRKTAICVPTISPVGKFEIPAATLASSLTLGRDRKSTRLNSSHVK